MKKYFFLLILIFNIYPYYYGPGTRIYDVMGNVLFTGDELLLINDVNTIGTGESVNFLSPYLWYKNKHFMSFSSLQNSKKFTATIGYNLNPIFTSLTLNRIINGGIFEYNTKINNFSFVFSKLSGQITPLVTGWDSIQSETNSVYLFGIRNIISPKIKNSNLKIGISYVNKFSDTSSISNNNGLFGTVESDIPKSDSYLYIKVSRATGTTGWGA